MRFNNYVAHAACVIAVLAMPFSAISQAQVEGGKPTLDAFRTSVFDALGAADDVGALAAAEAAVRSFGQSAEAYFLRARVHEAARRHERSIEDYGRALDIEPGAASLYNRRGSENFRLGRFEDSIEDFDKAIALDPRQAPQHWQRGISLYYAGRYEEGWRQFDSHKTVNPNDVENAVWRLLCMARDPEIGFVKARADFMPIARDGRVPMMMIHKLYAGSATAEEVIAEAERDAPSPNELRGRLFYAHLYIGLYHGARGEDAEALEHIEQAAGPYSVDHYMGDVARVHLRSEKK